MLGQTRRTNGWANTARWGGARVMSDRKPGRNYRADEIIKAFDRERSKARELSRRHAEISQTAHDRDRQVLIERRRTPR